MEILQLILSLLSKLSSGGSLGDILSGITGGGLELPPFLKNVDLNALASLFSAFSQNKCSPTENVGESYGLEPVQSITDINIVNALNGYFDEPS